MRKYLFERLVLRALWHLLWASIPEGAHWHAKWRDATLDYLDTEAEQCAGSMDEWEQMKRETRESFQK